MLLFRFLFFISICTQSPQATQHEIKVDKKGFFSGLVPNRQIEISTIYTVRSNLLIALGYRWLHGYVATTRLNRENTMDPNGHFGKNADDSLVWLPFGSSQIGELRPSDLLPNPSPPSFWDCLFWFLAVRVFGLEKNTGDAAQKHKKNSQSPKMSKDQSTKWL